MEFLHCQKGIPRYLLHWCLGVFGDFSKGYVSSADLQARRDSAEAEATTSALVDSVPITDVIDLTDITALWENSDRDTYSVSLVHVGCTRERFSMWQQLQKHRDEARDDLLGREAIDAWSNWRVQLVQLGTDRTDRTFRIAASAGSLLARIQMVAPLMLAVQYLLLRLRSTPSSSVEPSSIRITEPHDDMETASNGDIQPHDEAMIAPASSSEAPSDEQPYHSSPD
ncbi:unnamed protein product [Clonostachys rhizophaga]|uniref:Uncharacterized protein n=1 Tax=Clonostachys rhizophaga TaxID=160324 RepID=A0A9N9V1B9_9HYPO|nr:unnamed protein product [Clonostachys rhizophaga]